MPSYKHVVLIGAAAFAAVLVARASLRGAPAAAPPASEAPTASAALAPDEAARLRDELSRLRLQVAGLSEKAGRPAAEAPAKPESEPEGTLEEQRLASDRRWQAHMAEVAASFAGETRDVAWAATTGQVVKDVLGKDPAFAAFVKDVDCRSSSCRIELDHDDEGVVDHQLPLFLNSLVETLPAMEAEHSVVNGKARYTLYFKRFRPIASAD